MVGVADDARIVSGINSTKFSMRWEVGFCEEAVVEGGGDLVVLIFF